MNYGGTSRRNHLASSTSSSLSPLAPPFTVGRGGSSAAPPPYDPYASSWSLGKTSSAGPFDLPPADGSAYFGRGSTSGNLPQAEPYYPRYISPSGSGIQSPDGQRVLLPNTPFNVGVESEASGGSSFWGKAYGSDWQRGQGDLVSGEQNLKGEDSDNLRCVSGASPGEKISGASCFLRGISQLSPNTPVEEYISYSPMLLSYGSKYSSEVDGMKSDPVNFQKAAAYTDAVRHREYSGNPTFQSGDRYSEITKTEGMVAKSTSVKITAPPVIGSTNQIYKDHINGNPDINKETSGNPDIVSLDNFDEHLVIDSPCWKGASSSRNDKCSDGIFDYFLHDSSDYSTAHTEEVSRVLRFPKEVGNNKLCGKPSNDEVIGPLTTESVKEMRNLLSDPFCIPDLDKLMPSVMSTNDRCDAMSRPLLVSDSSSIMNPASQIDAQLLVKMIHNLSGVLVTTSCSNANTLKEQDQELLKLVINNLEKCISSKTEERMGPVPTSCSVSYSHELVTSPKDHAKGTFPSQSLKGIDGIRSQGEIHHKLFNSEEIAEGSKDDLWRGVEDAFNQLKHKLDALKSDLSMNKGCEPLKRLAQRPKKQSPLMLKVNPMEPSPLTQSPIDIDQVVMDRLKVLKDRMGRVASFDELESRDSSGRVDSRPDCDSIRQSGSSNFMRAPGRQFADFPVGSSDWEHVFKEELM